MVRFLLLLPALIGLVEGLLRSRGPAAIALNIVVASLGGIGLMIALYTLSGMPFSESRTVSALQAGSLIAGSLIGGALVALWLLNRLRR